MNLSLTPSLEQYVRDRASTGDYNNASEVVREAIRAGDEAMKRGDHTVINSSEELDEFFEKL